MSEESTKTTEETKAKESVATEKAAAPIKKKKGKTKRKISKGKVFVKSTYNNTIITVTDLNGNAIAWGSAGLLGFKGPKKSTPYAATTIMRSVLEKIKDTGLSEVEVFIKGIGGGREASVRALIAGGISISQINDVTPIPHNGCRPKKVRRV